MKVAIFGTWEAEVELESTQALYAKSGRAQSEICGCAYCKLFRRAQPFCDACGNQLRLLGIDPTRDSGNSAVPLDPEIIYLVQYQVHGYLTIPQPVRKRHTCPTCRVTYWLSEDRWTRQVLLLEAALPLQEDEELRNALRISR